MFQQQKSTKRISTTTIPTTTIQTTTIPTTKLNKESQITETKFFILNSEANAPEIGRNNEEISAGVNNEWNQKFDPDINITDIYNFECNYVESKSFCTLYNSFG